MKFSTPLLLLSTLAFSSSLSFAAPLAVPPQESVAVDKRAPSPAVVEGVEAMSKRDRHHGHHDHYDEDHYRHDGGGDYDHHWRRDNLVDKRSPALLSLSSHGGLAAVVDKRDHHGDHDDHHDHHRDGDRFDHHHDGEHGGRHRRRDHHGHHDDHHGHRDGDHHDDHHRGHGGRRAEDNERNPFELPNGLHGGHGPVVSGWRR